MIDCTKVNNLPVSVRKILAHEQLTFPMSNVANTGEILNRAQVARYRNMEFVVKGSYVKLRGSLHKHAQNGTNHMDFSFPDIQRVIEDLVNTFQFEPKEAHFNFIEIGVNIEVSTDPLNLIKNFLRYRHKEFESMQVNGAGYGRQCQMEQFAIKVYNKSMQYGLPINLLRVEVKVTRMEFLKQYGIHCLTMNDLKNPDVYPKLLRMLLDVFNRILLFNPDINLDSIQNPKDRELVLQGRFPEYWKELPRQRKCEKIRRFTELTGTNNLKKELAQLISDKWNILLNPDILTTFKTEDDQLGSDKLTTFNVELNHADSDKLTTFRNLRTNQPSKKTGQINTTINGYSRTCPITKADISMQKGNSHLLSNTGLMWLKQNEPAKYDIIRKRYLPPWGVSGLHTKFEDDEISHLSKQIRNEYYNRRRYWEKIPANQLAFL